MTKLYPRTTVDGETLRETLDSAAWRAWVGYRIGSLTYALVALLHACEGAM
jgi:hypothetical protein